MRRLCCEEPCVGELESGYLSMHAMCLAASQAWNTHLKGQILEHGHMDGRTGPGVQIFILAGVRIH